SGRGRVTGGAPDNPGGCDVAGHWLHGQRWRLPRANTADWNGGQVVGVGNSGLSELRRRSGLAAALVSLSVVLAACNSATIGSDSRNDVDVLGKIRSLDLQPRYPRQIESEQSPAARNARAAIYAGTTPPVVEQVAAAPRPSPSQSQPVGTGFER